MTTPLPDTLTPAQVYALVRPGDCLLYRPTKFDWKHLGAFFGAGIAIKTWHQISHCELYVGNGQSCASRDGQGVAQYPLRTSELAYVLRPSVPLAWPAFWAWFRTVNGQKYDWFGLVRFAWFKSTGGGNNGKMFCSEFLTRAYRALGVTVFNPDEDADAVAPFEFLVSPALTPIQPALPALLPRAF